MTNTSLAEIKIGAPLSLTGSIAFVGEANLQGMQLAVDQINAQGGIKGEKVVLKVEDDKSEVKDAVSAVAKLIEVDKIRIILGPIWSGAVIAVHPLIAKANAVLMGVSCTAPGVGAAEKRVFLTCPSASDQGVAGALLAKELGIKTVAILHLNNDYGKGLSNVFSARAEKLGISVPIRESCAPGSQDFRTQLTKIKGGNVKGLYCAVAGEIPNILQQKNQLMLDAVVIGTEGTYDTKVLERGKEDMEGLWSTAPPFWLESPDPVTQGFVKAFREKYKQDPRFFAAQGYDGALAIIEAMKREGTDPMKIRKGLLSLKNFPAPTGSITFLPNGDVKKPFAIFRVEKGKYVFKKLIME